ncbi:hypothetical protein Syun_014926 [Stephania yunnanensis]|uniref:Uncharacterized protein n=1 Tax=Stephania yunnanensis TaxID=152371 RepID=A0AAP0PCD6_9MAGN
MVELIVELYDPNLSLSWELALIDKPNTSDNAPVTQTGNAPTVHNPPATHPIQAGPAVADEAHVQAEIVPPTPETPAEDTPSTPTDTGVRATAETRHAREF